MFFFSCSFNNLEILEFTFSCEYESKKAATLVMHKALNRIADHFQAPYLHQPMMNMPVNNGSRKSFDRPGAGANKTEREKERMASIFSRSIGMMWKRLCVEEKLDGIINLRLIAREQVCGCLESVQKIETHTDTKTIGSVCIVFETCLVDRMHLPTKTQQKKNASSS